MIRDYQNKDNLEYDTTPEQANIDGGQPIKQFPKYNPRKKLKYYWTDQDMLNAFTAGEGLVVFPNAKNWLKNYKNEKI